MSPKTKSPDHGGKRPGSGRPKAARPLSQTPILTLRGSPEFAAWVARLAEHSRRSKAAVMEHALLSFAEGVGFKDPPPKR